MDRLWVRFIMFYVGLFYNKRQKNTLYTFQQFINKCSVASTINQGSHQLYTHRQQKLKILLKQIFCAGKNICMHFQKRENNAL